MKTLKRLLPLVSLGITCTLLAVMIVSAQQSQQRPQQRPQMDPEQMLQRMLDRTLNNLDASQEELAVLKPRIEAILRAQFDDSQKLRQATNELRTAVDAGDNEAIRAKLDAYKALRQAIEKKSQTLESELLELLTLKQEAQLTLAGVVHSNGGFGGMIRFGGGMGQRPTNRQGGRSAR